MDDERIEHALKLGPVDEPPYRARMREKVDGDHATTPAAATPELGVMPIGAPTRIHVHARGASRARHAPRMAGFAQVAAVLAIVVVAGALALPGLVGRMRPGPDVLARLAEKRVLIGVLNTLPQTVSSGGVHIGFDVDVARAVADALGLRSELAALPPGDLEGAPWDIALGPAGLVGSAPIVTSQPYAYSPAWLAVAAASPIRVAGDINGRRVCVASGSSAARQGDAALRTLGNVVTVDRESDDACISALQSGQAEAMVTSVLLDDELASRGLRALPGGPLLYEPRVVQIRGSADDAATALAAVNRAIDDLRATGRLAELSRQSFGGRDLTEVKP